MARVLVDALQPLRIIRWQQTQQARDQGRVLHLVHPVAAQVHDPARHDLGQVAFHIRDPAGLQPFEQAKQTIAVLPIPPRPVTHTSLIPGSVTYLASRPVSTRRPWNRPEPPQAAG